MYEVQINNEGEVTTFRFWDYGDAIDFAFDHYTDDNPYHHVVINCDAPYIVG